MAYGRWGGENLQRNLFILNLEDKRDLSSDDRLPLLSEYRQEKILLHTFRTNILVSKENICKFHHTVLNGYYMDSCSIK